MASVRKVARAQGRSCFRDVMPSLANAVLHDVVSACCSEVVPLPLQLSPWKFGSRVDVKYVWNIMDFGYKAEEILWLVESGILSLGYQSSSYLTDRVPELGCVDLPFLFSSNAQARAAMDGVLGDRLARKIEEK